MEINDKKKKLENEYLNSIKTYFNNQYLDFIINDLINEKIDEEREYYRNILMGYGMVNNYYDIIEVLYGFSTLKKKNKFFKRNKYKFKIKNDEEFHTAILYLIYLENTKNNVKDKKLKKEVLKYLSFLKIHLNPKKIIKKYQKSILIRKRILKHILMSLNIQKRLNKIYKRKTIERKNALLDRIEYKYYMNKMCFLVELLEYKYLSELFKISFNFNVIKEIKKENICLLETRKVRNKNFQNIYVNDIESIINFTDKITPYVLFIISIGFAILFIFDKFS